MRLFTKTFVFFMSVIILQASLTVLIITNIMRKNDLEDAKRVLAGEAADVQENYHAWKRIIWMDLIGLSTEKRLKPLLLRSDDPPTRAVFRQFLNDRVFVSGIDCLLLKSARPPFFEIVPRGYSRITLEDVKGLRNEMPHPYIRTEFLGSICCMVGRVGVETAPGGSVDVFLIKFLDEPFFEKLVINRGARASLFLNGEFLVGAFKDERSITTSDMASSYREQYGVDIKKKSYNVAVQRVESDPGLFLAVYLSNQPYQERLHQVRRMILYVLALGASLTALLSLFLSKNISRPVKELLRSMQFVKQGRYAGTMRTLPANEIGELFRGFDDMARTLGEDRAQMDRYIGEILQLKDYNEKIVDSLRAGVAIVSPDLTVEKANSAFLEYFRLSGRDVSGKNIGGLGLEAVDREVIDTIPSILRGEKGFFSTIKRTREGKVFEIKLYPIAAGDALRSGCVLTAEDVSEKVELEHKIFQAEKLASLSILSAGVAHEINNPLSSIMSNVQNLLEEERAEEKRTSLKWIEQETRRIARIIRELLNFASSASKEQGGCDVKDVIERVVNLIRYSIKKEKNVAIETELQGGLPRSVVGEDELKQIMINLIYNSIQAIDGSGSVKVRAEREGVNGAVGGAIGVAVEDDGRGMSGEVMRRVFDPFFTTKTGSGGTGLGLSVVYGIVRKYNGSIDVRSAEGKGTTVRLVLPAQHA